MADSEEDQPSGFKADLTVSNPGDSGAEDETPARARKGPIGNSVQVPNTQQHAQVGNQPGTHRTAPAAHDDPSKIIPGYKKKKRASGRPRRRVIRVSGLPGPNTNAVKHTNNRRRARSSSELFTGYSTSNVSH